MPSPDGEHFFYVCFYGELESDSVVYELHVHASRDIQRELEKKGRNAAPIPSPLRRLEMKSRHSDEFAGAAIYQPHWESNKTIVFLGTLGDGPRRVYRLNISTGDLAALTGVDHDVASGPGQSALFELRGNSVAFTSEHRERWAPLDKYPAASVTEGELGQITSPWKLEWRSYVTYRNGAARHFLTRSKGESLIGPWISPDETQAIAVYPPTDRPIPPEWYGYEMPPKHGYTFMLIDMKTGSARPILNSPAGTLTHAGYGIPEPFRAFWSSDSRHVLLFNTTLPLNENAEERRRMSYVIDYTPHSGKWSVVQPMVDERGAQIQRANWLEDGKKLLVHYASADASTTPLRLLTFTNGHWVASQYRGNPQLKPNLRGNFTVQLRESTNEPPTIVASNERAHLVLTKPDPALEGVWRAPAELIQWTGSDGTDLKAWLMMPQNYPKEETLPLVIQAIDGTFDPIGFRPDGEPSTGFAAQALVAQGFMVLQMPFFPEGEKGMFTAQEGPTRVIWVDSAVQMLARRGGVDVTRVGLVGYSRSGFLAYYIATHPGHTRISAAVVQDSVTAGYGEYVISKALGDDSAIYEKQYGVGTFWENKSGWMDAPAFNLDRISAPTLFTAAGEGNAWSLLETVGAFRYARKPFEYLYFARGSHVLQRPREREAAMQATVDWMSFWLQDRERTSLDERRLTRWRAMKAEWRAERSGDTAESSRSR